MIPTRMIKKWMIKLLEETEFNGDRITIEKLVEECAMEFDLYDDDQNILEGIFKLAESIYDMG